jgi:thiol-disulfide isomerase/thioredoxin
MRRITITLLLLAATQVQVAAQSPSAAVNLKGTIVCCQNCWAKADRRTVQYGTAADLAQAAQCIAKGDPTLLAVMDSAGTTTFYQLESGAFKRLGKNWLEYVGKSVEVTGTTRSKKDVRYIKVDELKVLASPTFPPAISPQDVIGTDAELVLKDVLDIEQRLSAYRGRVVVLNFWATYCIPCKKEMPDLVAVQNQYAALGVQVIGAAADDTTALPKVKQFIKDVKINFPVWIGATADDMERFGLGSALPGTLVIGRDGKIVAVMRGVVKAAELRRQLDTLLAGSEPPAEKQIASNNKSTDTSTKKASTVPS